jgi:nucleotide-binding universal stress UspA family protein
MRALVAIDLDDAEGAAETTAARARSLLERLYATVDLLYVAPPLPTRVRAEWRNDEVKALLEHAVTRLDAELDARLSALLATWPSERRGTVEVVRATRPAQEIVDRAVGRDLVVVGTHRRQGWQRAWLGSVAELVVRSSPIPVLVVPGDVPPGKDRILAAVDVRDDASAQIVAAAGEIATRLGTAVDLLQIIIPPPYDEFRAPTGSTRVGGMELGVQERADAERALDRLRVALPPDQRGAVVVEWGDPSRSVADLAPSHLLVVVGTHGRHGLERALLGSVAEWIVRRCEAPVLVVPLTA